MRRTFFILLCCYLLLFNLTLDAAIPTQTEWNILPTAGAAANGGCHVVGSPGTNYLFQNSPQYNAADLATTSGTTNPSVVTSAAHNFVATDVGNCIHVTAGTNWTAGFYPIVSVAANAATLDRAVGTSATLSSGTYAVGGGLDSAGLQVAINAGSSGNIFFLKASGTLVTTASIVVAHAVTPASNVPPNQIIGYTATPGDGGRATIQGSTTSGMTLLGGTFDGWIYSNLILDCDNLTGCTGLQPYIDSSVVNVKVMNFTARGIYAGGGIRASVTDSETTGGGSGCIAGIYFDNPGSSAIRNWTHDSACPGISLGSSNQVALYNVASNNTGASGDGIVAVNGSNYTIVGNTAYGNARDGIHVTGPITTSNIRNNILMNNAGCGLSGAASAGWAAFPMWDGNAYRGNGTARCNLDDTGSVNPINGAAPYTNIYDVTLSADPFTNAAGNDFTLNTTSGGGAAVRGSGTPGPMPGGIGTGHMPMGPLAPVSCASAGMVTTSCGFVQ